MIIANTGHFIKYLLLLLVNQASASYDLTTPIKSLKTLTKEQIENEVRQRNWAETRQ